MPAMKRNKTMRHACALGIGMALLAASSSPRAAALPAFEIDSTQTSVSGLSSGGFMAVQFAVAHSAIVKGAGVIAGGPYYCARGNVSTATTVCSCTTVPVFFMCRVAPGATKVDELIDVTERHAGQGAIDPTAGLARQRYWLFSGTLDSVVPPAVMTDLQAYLRHYGDPRRIRYENRLRAEHAMPTDGYGNDCGKLGEPYISNCRFDAAGELLQWIYEGSLRPAATGAAAGRMLEFDQRPFVSPGDAAGAGLADSGFVYIPSACEHGGQRGGARRGGQRCRLHIVFHGCRQNVASVGDRFIRHAGYNRWADANQLIVLYPQTTATRNNPKACWNWFDAERDDAAYATRNGRQIRAVKGMVDRIAGLTAPDGPAAPAAPACFTASNFDHIRAGRAHLDFFLWARANGSNAGLGFADAFGRTTLRRTGPNHYVIGTCS